MSKLIHFICLLLACSALKAQKMPSDYFDEGVNYVNDTAYGKAAASFRYIVDHHPHNALYPEAYYNLGYVYYKNHQEDSAVIIFQSILHGNFNEKQEIGGDIMSDPYANYRHRCCMLLCDLYSEKMQYDSALHYLALADTVYDYIHFCGNELAGNKVYMAQRYAELYEKTNQPQKAIHALLKVVFEDELTDNSDALKMLGELLKKEKITDAKAQLDDALDKMYLKTWENGKNHYKAYFIHFLGTEMQVSYRGSKEKSIEEVRNSAFYKMISAL